MPVDVFLTRTGKEMGPASRDLILLSVHEAARQIKEGKGTTHYETASAIGRICQAIVHHATSSSRPPLSSPKSEGCRRQRSARIVKEATDSVLPRR